jgi:hypothetical protein
MYAVVFKLLVINDTFELRERARERLESVCFATIAIGGNHPDY